MSRFIYQARLGQLLLALLAALLLWCIPSTIAASTVELTDNSSGRPNTELDSTSVEGTVWLDTNQDGHRDEDEPSVAGIIVDLVDSWTGATLQRKATDENGSYQFQVPSGAYRVRFEADEGSFTTAYGSDETWDSDANPNPGSSFGLTELFHLEPGEQASNLDAGLLPAVIEGSVWLDQNRNGIREDDEILVGPSALSINLLDGTHHTLLQGAMTDSNGAYTFTVPPGSYVIEFVVPINGLTSLHQGPDRSRDSDAVSLAGERFGQTSPITLDFGDRFTNVDAGLFPAIISDTVWLDLNDNHQHDEDERGIAGIWVILLDGIGNPLQSTITDAQGAYQFTFSPDRTIYFLQFASAFRGETTLADTEVQSEEEVTGEAASKAVDVGTWLQETASVERYIWQQTEPIALAYGQQYGDVNIGLQAAQLGGTVWHDFNGNAIREAEELGLGGIEVILFDSVAQNAIMTTTSDDDGSYHFVAAPGTYELHFETPVGAFFSPQPPQIENSFDEEATRGIVDSDVDDVVHSDVHSDVDPITGQTAAFEITFGERKLDYDAAIYEGAVLGDRVWFDVDGNGRQDEHEAGIADVALHLYNSQSAIVATTHSDSKGFYRFGNLSPDHYYITIDMSEEYLVSLPGQGQVDSDNDLNIATQQTHFITVTSGNQYMSVDIGLTQVASLQNYVWFDDDRDGVREPGEKGMTGVGVTLYDKFNRFVMDTVTDGEGRYHFEDIHPGLYTLEFYHETGFGFADLVRGDSPEHDSDVDPYTSRTVLFQLNAGEVSRRWGAGLIIPRDEIELLSFNAQADDANVLLRWRTSHAVAQTGFRIYRNDEPERQGAERVRASIEISEQHQQATPIYHYLMTEPIEDVFSTEVYYWLTDVENGVEVAEHGPIQATGQSDALGQHQVLVFLPFINK